MNSFFVTLDLSGTYVSDIPGLEILLDGEVVSSGQVSTRTGSGFSSLSFTLTSSSSTISSLSFRFSDNGGEAGRSITIERVAVNNYTVSSGTYVLNDGGQLNDGNAVIQQNETLDININAIDFVFGQADATLADLDAVTITGKNSSEKIVGGKQSAVIDGRKGHDEIRSGQEDDQVFGGEGNDMIFGNDGDDFLIGGLGNDRIEGRRDNDLIYGSEGNDRLNGGEGNDVISGGTGTDRLYGGEGNDILDGGADGDIIYGQDGDDHIHGGGGTDNIRTGSGDDVVHGGDDDDRIVAEGGSNILNGDAGADRLFADNDGQVDTLNGGAGDDEITGGDNGDIINGGGDNDRIEGRGGADIIDGGDGDDLIYGQDGNDEIHGGAGARDDLYGGAGDDVIYGDAGFNKIFGEDGNDIMHGGDDIDVIRGGDGNDTLNGGAGEDRLFGDNGNDIINGGDGNDWLRGLAGADTINGGAGDDFIIHDDNTDIIDGGAGYDLLQLAGTNGNNINASAGDLNAINIEEISLVNYNGVPTANILTLSVADIASISGGGTLRISGDVGVDTITVSNLDLAGDLVGSVLFDGINYNHYLSGGNNLYLQAGVIVLTSSAPIAADDIFSGTEDNNVTGNVLADNGNGIDDDPAGGSFNAVADTITTAAGGTVTLQASGDFVYVPVADFEGTDTFTYSISNLLGETDAGLVTLNIAGKNDGPTARDDDFTATQNIALTGDLLADNGNGADSDVETLVLSTQAETITTSNGATVEINGDGTFVYTPSTGFIGPDSFSYTLLDDDGGSDTANVSVVVRSPNALPEGDISLLDTGGASTSIPDSVDVNTGGPYAEKTTIVTFETGADVTTRQTIYEQGGGTRGINIYVENGELHMAVWNYAEEAWGYKEVTTTIGANESHSAALILDGALPTNGTISGYLDGVSIGSDTGVGLLYAHGDDIGIGQVDGSTVYNNASSTAANVFQGTIGGVAQYNEILSLGDINNVVSSIGTPDPIFAIEDVQQDTVPNDPAINEGGPYPEKTLSVAFVAGADVAARQVIYEQGGTVRGMSIFVEGGQLHVAAWNRAEENWGFKEVTTDINADTFYTATLVLNGTQAETGTLTGFLNGIQFGQASNVGILYNHPGAVGIGEQVNGAYYAGGADGGDGVYQFGGSIERIVQYNDALEGSGLLELHSAMAGQNPDVTDNTFIGDNTDNAIGGGNGDDNIQARDGNDSLSGNGGNDTLRGENGNDVLYGDSGNDFLYGGAGNDVLVGGTGLDVMYGDGGADVFAFLQMDGNIDQIRDFTLGGAEGDKLNITDILDGFDVGVDNINDFVIVNVVNSARTDIRVNADGAGNDSEVLAIVRGADFTGNTAQDLLDNGHLIVDQTII